MKKFIPALLYIISIISVQSISAQPHYEFAYGLGSIGTEYINTIAVDDVGNFYTAGSYSSALDFDATPYTTTLEPEGSSDAYFCKYDQFGQLVWARSFGGDGSDGVNKMFVDDAGNIYVAGYFNGTADLDPDLFAVNVTAVGEYDIFFSKFDNTGDFLWGKSIGGLHDDFCTGIAADADGNVYVTGGFENTVDFDANNFAEHEETSFGSYDGYLTKYDNDGNFVWVNAYGGTGIDYSTDLAIDNAGRIIIGGAFEGTVPFGGGYNLTAAGGALYETDPFFAKYDADGSIYWAKSIYGNSGHDAYNPNYVIALTTDADNNVIVTGNFWITADFDPGVTAAQLTTIGGSDTYIAKYDSDGNYQWAVNYCGITYERSDDIAVDAQNAIYVIGLFALSATADFDPTGGELLLNSEGDYDIYLTKYSEDGNMQWAFNAGGEEADYGYTLAVNNNYDIYCGGWYWSDIADFYPEEGDATITHFDGGGEDIWFAKYTQPEIADAIEENVQQQLIVYPNPANDNLTVQFDDLHQAKQIEIYSGEGKFVRTITASEIEKHTNSIEISVTDIPPGIYFIKILTDKMLVSKILIE